LKMELYDKNGELLKVSTMETIERVQGYWTPMENVMENVQTGHRTRLAVQKIRYNEDLNPDLFSTNFLRTGRVR